MTHFNDPSSIVFDLSRKDRQANTMSALMSAHAIEDFQGGFRWTVEFQGLRLQGPKFSAKILAVQDFIQTVTKAVRPDGKLYDWVVAEGSTVCTAIPVD